MTSKRKTASKPVTFRDRHYAARRVELEGGFTAVVVDGRATVAEPAAIAALEAHPDFERVAGEREDG